MYEKSADQTIRLFVKQAVNPFFGRQSDGFPNGRPRVRPTKHVSKRLFVHALRRDCGDEQEHKGRRIYRRVPFEPRFIGMIKGVEHNKLLTPNDETGMIGRRRCVCLKPPLKWERPL